MFLFQKGQTIDNRYTVVFPHKEGSYAETCRVGLLPQWFVSPPARTAHGCGIDCRIFGEQYLDVLSESIRRIDGVKPVGDIAQVGVELFWDDLPIGNPDVWQTLGKDGGNDDIGVPKSGMVSTDVPDDGDTTQPCTQIFKFGNTKAATDGLFYGIVFHVAIKPGKRTHRGNLHRLPHRRHGRRIVFAEVLQDIFIFGAVEFFLQAPDVACEQIAVFCQCPLHKPEGTVTLGKQTYQTGADCDFYLLYCREHKESQFFIESVKTDDFGKTGVWLEDMALPVTFHETPVACQPEIADGIKNGYCFCFVFYQKSPLLQNVNLLLERQQLLGIFHRCINKKCPALVRYIHLRREAAAGSIGCKGTTFNRNFQMIWQKSCLTIGKN